MLDPILLQVKEEPDLNKNDEPAHVCELSHHVHATHTKVFSELGVFNLITEIPSLVGTLFP